MVKKSVPQIVRPRSWLFTLHADAEFPGNALREKHQRSVLSKFNVRIGLPGIWLESRLGAFRPAVLRAVSEKLPRDAVAAGSRPDSRGQGRRAWGCGTCVFAVSVEVVFKFYLFLNN